MGKKKITKKILTKKLLLEMLDSLPDDGQVNIYILPEDEGLREDSDEHDIMVDSIEPIYTGGLDSEEPYIELGIVVGEQTKFKEGTKTN